MRIFELNQNPISGTTGADLHGDLHDRDVHKDIGFGLHPPQEQLHEEPLEHHGLCCRCLRVRQFLITVG